MSVLVEKLVDAIAPYSGIPLALFGHSMGALISFELARTLQHQRGVNPLHLFVAGHGAPHLPAPRPPIHNLPTPLFIEKLRELNGTPEVILRDPELMRLFLPPLRADFELLESYVFNEEQPLDFPITAFGGIDDKLVSKDAIGAWSGHTRATFKLYMFPGDHFFLNNSRMPLLRVIGADLAV